MIYDIRQTTVTRARHVLRLLPVTRHRGHARH